MSRPIEDYGFIGNTLSCALVARDGSIDWLCLPRFDSDACLAALLGGENNGFWHIRPAGEYRVTRAYRDSTTILETSFETADGVVTLIDFMPLSDDEERVDVMRMVRGVRGRVAMRMDFVLRFGNGEAIPWVRRQPFGLSAIAGPDAVELHAPVELKNRNMRTAAAFEVNAGDSLAFTLCYHPSHKPPRGKVDVAGRLAATEAEWRQWAARCTFDGDRGPPRWREAVVRSLVTLKALTYRPSGGIVAAPTTSLPERIGGERNWDYRYCWIRDATMTLYALLSSGFRDEAKAWRAWMLRAGAGHPAQLQIMYGLNGERRLTEYELPWLAGYENSKPVRIGNAAHAQLQLDVYGELVDALHVARKFDLDPSDDSWSFQKVLLEELEKKWQDPDEGIWEVRGPRRHFTHSRLMAWVAFDRAILGVEQFGLAGPADHWREVREAIRADILANGWSEKRGSFVQSYGSDALDASLLLVPVVGFLPAEDRRVVSTIEAIQRELTRDGLVMRYRTEEANDGLPGHEGTFLVCSFWMADALSMIGRRREAEELFERLLAMRNDLGLLAEEYDPVAGRQLGNFPQAFSHVGIVNTASNLISRAGPAEQRSHRAGQVPRSSVQDAAGGETLA